MNPALMKLNFWRTKARLLFKALLVVGFAAQSWTFLQMYLRYPSMLQLTVEQPAEVVFPAFTVCNLNEVRSGPYCERYPKRCGSPKTDPSFCTRFSEYCRLVNDTSKLVPNVTVEQYNLTRYEQQLFGHQWTDLVTKCEVHIDDDITGCKSTPLLVPALSHSNRVPYNCYMMYSVHGKPDVEPEKVPISAVIHLQLNVEVSQYHPYHLSRGAQISIHSPHHVPSPTSDGQLLNLGKIYRFYLRLARQNLLPAPYHSNCTDYMSEWKRNGGQGPVTNNMCIEKCKLDLSMSDYGCVHPTIDYPHNETFCVADIPHFQKRARSMCSSQCSMPCMLLRYEFQVQEANSEGDRKSCMNSTDLSCAILVQIFLENMEITTFTYRPTYEAVGILSWIGGYVGLWLGISLLTVYDFLEKWTFRLVAALRRRFKRRVRRSKAAALWSPPLKYQKKRVFRRLSSPRS